MRTIAVVNQKGGVGKTTTVVNLGAALARRGCRVVVVDLDPQANLTMHLGLEIDSRKPSSYDVLCGEVGIAEALRETSTPGLRALASNIDLSGAELELASQMGRESLLRDAIQTWTADHRAHSDEHPADFLFFDCPPSLGLLAINGLVACEEIFIALQTEFFALQGMSKLVEIVQLLQRRLNPALVISGIVPSLYDSRLRLAREVLAEIRKYFPGQVFRRGIGTNVKLAEAPSYGRTIFEYAPESKGAADYEFLAEQVLAQGGGADRAEPAPGIGEPRAEPCPEPTPEAVEAPQRELAPQPPPREVLRADDLPELPRSAFGQAPPG